jgi:hypothetical protein
MALAGFGLPQFLPQFKNRYYSVATTSSSGTPTSQVVVVSRCKYLGGYFAPNQAGGASPNGFDVLSVTQATSVSSGLVSTITSGVSVTTSTGTLGIPFGPFASGSTTGLQFLSPGDLILTVASTCQGGFITHVVQEF